LEDETSEGKLAIGIGVLVVTAAVVIVCPAVLGAAAATVTQFIATSALVGSAISGIMNGAASVKAGKSFFDGFASGVEEGAIIGTATYIYHGNKYDKAITGGDVAKTWAECAITSFVLRSVFEGGKSSSKADGKNRGMSTSKGRVESERSITCEGGSKTINPKEIRYSQSSVNGSSEIIDSMKKNGWKGDPIDVVEMPDGIYTTIDNTRVVSAREAGINVKANVHGYNDILPEEYIERFTTKKGVPVTWGDAISLRVGKQKASFRNSNPFGAFDMDTIK
jgi:hypothetical protein